MTEEFSPEFEKRTYWRVTRRLIPFLFLSYIFAYVDRVNVGFAKLQMQGDLGFSNAVYGAGAGIFFIGYFFFEVPCNLALQKIGAKYWLGPIMIVWGFVSASTMFVRTEFQFYALRLLLGIVESGFFPGVILYLTFWFPSKYRAKMIAAFMTAIPLSGVIGGPISGWILASATNLGGLRGWQWLYVFEGLPSLLMGILTMIVLADGPRNTKWLDEREKSLLLTRLEEEEMEKRLAGSRGRSRHRHTMMDAFRSGKTWLLAVIYFGFVMGNYGLGFWLPQIVKDTLTKDPLRIGLLTAIPWAVAAVSMVLVGHHSDTSGERCWHIALTGIIGSLAFAASGIPGISGAAGLFTLTIATAGIVCAYTVFWALPSAFLSGAAASAGIAWINSIGNLAGYFSPAIIGKIQDTTHSMTPALFMLAGCAFAASTLTVIFFHERSTRKIVAHEPA